jgi:hypothetical protein
MDIQENQDLEDLLEVQEVQDYKEHLGLKVFLVIRVAKGSQVYQVNVKQVLILLVGAFMLVTCNSCELSSTH